MMAGQERRHRQPCRESPLGWVQARQAREHVALAEGRLCVDAPLRSVSASGDLARQQEWRWDGALGVPTGAGVLRGRTAFSLDLQSVVLRTWVSAAKEVSVQFQSGTGAPVELGIGTLCVKVEKT